MLHCTIYVSVRTVMSIAVFCYSKYNNTSCIHTSGLSLASRAPIVCVSWSTNSFLVIHAFRNNERPEELKELYKACIISGVAGFMFGGYAQARRSRVHFIDTHNTYIFPSHMQAQVFHLWRYNPIGYYYHHHSDNCILPFSLDLSEEVFYGGGNWELLPVSSGAVNKLHA